MGKQVSIACKPDGPYLVSNLADLRDAGGKPIEAKSMMALCRCGGSAKKPFCDGTHAKNGFSGARLSDGSADRLDTYTADGITIHDNRSICAHAGHCTAGLETVFRYGKEPWIVASGGLREKIIETVRNCPSGALACSSEGAQAAEPKREPAITVTRDGPYAVVGSAALPGQAWAQGASTEHFTLCRCGASKNKPFCDGSHWAAGFKDG